MVGFEPTSLNWLDSEVTPTTIVPGGRSKPVLSCINEDRVTICAEGVRVGDQLEIEVQFDSDPAPTKVKLAINKYRA